MIYGKVVCKIASPHGTVFLTVKGDICTIKQNGDMVRLELVELRELQNDVAAAIAEFERGGG